MLYCLTSLARRKFIFDLEQCMISANLHNLNLLDQPKQLILSVVLLQHLDSNHSAFSLALNLNIHNTITGKRPQQLHSALLIHINII